MLNLELDRAPVVERRMEPPLIVDLVDEVRKRMNDVGERLIATELDLFILQRLHKAFGFGIVVGNATTAHRTAEPVFH